MSVEAWIALLATLVGFFASWLGIRGSFYTRRLEYEDVYQQRYWQIIDRIPHSFRPGGYVGATEKEIGELKENHPDVFDALWDYISLCEDQIDQRRNGNFTDETWFVWAESIRASISAYPCCQLLDSYEKKLGKNEGVFLEVRSVLRTGRLIDPFRSRYRWTRWAAGYRRFGTSGRHGKRRT